MRPFVEQHNSMCQVRHHPHHESTKPAVSQIDVNMDTTAADEALMATVLKLSMLDNPFGLNEETCGKRKM